MTMMMIVMTTMMMTMIMMMVMTVMTMIKSDWEIRLALHGSDLFSLNMDTFLDFL